MPLYMECHSVSNLSMPELQKKVGAANETLRKFKVRYHQFWLNEESGMVFSLMEGPSKSVCEAVHLNIHGDTSYSIIPVKEGMQNVTTNARLLLSDNPPIHQTGLDHGFILLACLDPNHECETSPQLKQLIRNIITSCDGIEISSDSPLKFAAYFSSGRKSVTCASALQHSLIFEQKFFRFRISVATTLSTDQKPERDLLSRAESFCRICEDSSLVICDQLRDHVSPSAEDLQRVRILSLPDEHFLNTVLHIIADHISDDSFNVDVLAREAGFSRPQLYRKIHSLTGRSPNVFIRDIRMEKALSLLRWRDRNICEVALEVGYTNPSYFARTFSERYGCTPSGYLTLNELIQR
jgi:AraC-like DNA-binding protein